MHKQSMHARQIGADVRQCEASVDAPNCSTHMFLKVMTACKNVSAAIRAACAPPIKSSRKKAMTPPSSVRAAGKACAMGKAASAARKAAPRRSWTGQCNKTCYMDSMLSGYSQARHMRSCLSWLG